MGWSPISLRDLVLVLVLLPNFAQVPIGLAQLWTIGFEEQFYAIYPQLFRRVSLIKLCFLVIAIRWELLLIINAPPFVIYGDLGGLRQWLVGGRFDAFAIGALFAYMVYRNHPYLRLFYRVFPVMILLFVIAVLFPSNSFGNSLYDTVFAIACGALHCQPHTLSPI